MHLFVSSPFLTDCSCLLFETSSQPAPCPVVPRKQHQNPGKRDSGVGPVSCCLLGVFTGWTGKGVKERREDTALSPFQQHVDTPQVASLRLAVALLKGFGGGVNPRRLPGEGASKPRQGFRVNLCRWQENPGDPPTPGPSAPSCSRGAPQLLAWGVQAESGLLVQRACP